MSVKCQKSANELSGVYDRDPHACIDKALDYDKETENKVCIDL